jgi:signal recognition particle receptor subunit beta
MVIYNAATRELTAKIVYYGPGLCGKTTNLKVLHDRLEPGTAGKLLNLQTQTDRTIYFDLLPVELGDIKGYKIRFQLATVPGQTAFNETRRVVLKGVDGIVFVADSQWTMLPKNLEAWQNLKDNLKSNAITFESIPVVIQYNKRDLADILAVDAMQEALGLSSYPFVEAVASAGRGVTETFKLISKLTFVDLLRRLQGRRAEDEEASRETQELTREDDLQTWKDSLLKRDSQPAIARPSRPLSLVPPVPEEAPFDTTELGRGVDDEEAESPYSVPPPEMGMPSELDMSEPPPAINPAATIQMDAIASHFDFDVPEPAPPMSEAPEEDEAPEVLSEADEVRFEAPEEATSPEVPVEAPEPMDPAAASAFLSAEAARDERLDVLEQRLQEVDARAGREREAAERLFETVAATEARVAAAAEHLSALTERLSAVERGVGGLHEALGSALQRLSATEGAAGRTGELEGGIRRLEATISQLEGEMRGEAGRHRKDSDDMTMALSALTERAQAVDRELSSAIGRLAGHNDRLAAVAELAERNEEQLGALRSLAQKLPGFEAQIESILQDHRALEEALEEKARLASREAEDIRSQVDSNLKAHRELEEAFEEKTQLGRREAEDIRSQLAPLLEDRVRRHESDAMLFGEMERLRESLAESLHDLAERVRSRVRE